MSFFVQKQLGTTLHKSQQRIDQRVKKWQDLRQAVESVKVGIMLYHLKSQSGCFPSIYYKLSPVSVFYISSALSPNGPRGEWANLHWASAFHREEVQWNQGDDQLARKDHCDTGRDTARSFGGRDHSAEEEAHWPGEAVTRWRSYTLSAGKADLLFNLNTRMKHVRHSWNISSVLDRCLITHHCLYFPFSPELAVSVRPLRIWRLEQHQCRSLLLFWCYQESNCCNETTSGGSQQDWNKQSVSSRWSKLPYLY